VAKSGTT